MFKGLYPLYTCHVIEEEHTKMLIRCSQLDYDHSKVIDRVLYSTNNYKFYYRNTHFSILTSVTEEKEHRVWNKSVS
jgi:hypothetical protein